MFKTLKNAWAVKEIRSKILFTLAMLFIYRLGNFIPLPFVNREALQSFFTANNSSLLGFLDMMAGGALSRLSIFASNIYPYINASIIIQLLTVAIPKLEELAKEGETGRRKINRYTRYLTIVLAVVQGIGTVFGLLRGTITGGTWAKLLMVLCLVAGTQFLVFLGDQITEKGVGNGISLIIFLGIIARLPDTVGQYFKLTKAGQYNIINVIVMVIAMIAIVAFVVLIQEGERRIGVQYAKRVVGRKMYGGQSTHIPIKVLMTGVMPIIFANSLLAIPATIAMFTSESTRNWIQKWLTPTGGPGAEVFIPGAVIYIISTIILIVFFTFFYTTIQFNTVEYSKNLQANGGFISGIRAGKPTSDYLGRTLNRLVMPGAIALSILAVLPTILTLISGLQFNYGGTSIIIVVGVVLEIHRVLEQQLIMRNYRGFLKNK